MSMKYNKLGNTDIEVSNVGLGCMNFGMVNSEEESIAIVHKALEMGVTFFDTADVYSSGNSEQWLGKALANNRSEVIVATKFCSPTDDGEGASRDYIMKAVDNSLQRLNTDYIDLYQIHRPDPNTPMEETLRALDELVQSGKVRHIGCSNLPAWQVADADWLAKTENMSRFVTTQNRLSLLCRDIEDDLVPAAKQYGIDVIPYFPLESGMLTGKYKRGVDHPEGTRLAKWRGAFTSDDRYDKLDKLQAFCDESECTLLDVAMGWITSRDYIPSVIAGVSNIEQLEQNIAASQWQPTADEERVIDEITANPKSPFGMR
jgi:aryl-alcohol dehydrogenase-like predicted oxidoreductase